MRKNNSLLLIVIAAFLGNISGVEASNGQSMEEKWGKDPDYIMWKCKGQCQAIALAGAAICDQRKEVPGTQTYRECRIEVDLKRDKCEQSQCGVKAGK